MCRSDHSAHAPGCSATAATARISGWVSGRWPTSLSGKRVTKRQSLARRLSAASIPSPEASPQGSGEAQEGSPELRRMRRRLHRVTSRRPEERQACGPVAEHHQVAEAPALRGTWTTDIPSWRVKRCHIEFDSSATVPVVR
jgi:hypothetical protein